jgi:hypothetical protein
MTSSPRRWCCLRNYGSSSAAIACRLFNRKSGERCVSCQVVGLVSLPGLVSGPDIWVFVGACWISTAPSVTCRRWHCDFLVASRDPRFLAEGVLPQQQVQSQNNTSFHASNSRRQQPFDSNVMADSLVPPLLTTAAACDITRTSDVMAFLHN